MNVPVSKLDKPTALACWYLHVDQLTILVEDLSQVVIRYIGIQITNEYLQEKLSTSQEKGCNRFNFPSMEIYKVLTVVLFGSFSF